MNKAVGLSLGALALASLVRGGSAGAQSPTEDPADGGSVDGGSDAGVDPEPTMMVCLCALQQPGHALVVPAGPHPVAGMDLEAVRARVLASLPAELRNRV